MGDTAGDPVRAKRDNTGRSLEEPATLPDAAAFPFASPNVRVAPRTPEVVTAAVNGEPKAARSHVFDTLVKAEDDIVGFVAYGLYKQSKRDWFAAFEKEHRRAPNSGEVSSFIVGESTERRLATYRQLAESTLAQQSAGPPRARLPVPVGNSSAGSESSPNPFALGRRAYLASAQRGRTRGSLLAILSYLVLVILIVVGMAWVLRSGLLGFGHW